MAGQTTPGPWRHLNHLADERRFRVAKYDPRNRGDKASYAVLAECKPVAPSAISEDEAMANATLIAAAPELLAACELALRILDRDGIQSLRGTAWTDTEREQIEAAVAKARGE